MESLVQYLLYFLVGGGATAIIAYYNTHGNAGLAAILGCMPMHFLVNVMIALLVAGPMVAMKFSRVSIVTNFAWVGAVLVFAIVLQRTESYWLAIPACMVAGVVFNAMMNEVFDFV